MGDEEAGQGAIVPVEQQHIDFYGDQLIAVRDEGGTVWVPVRPLCRLLGVNWSGQYQRILRDPVMAEALQAVCVTQTAPSGESSVEMLALPLKFVRAWLFGINATRVKPEIREKLIAYQREIIEIIDRAFARLDPMPLDADEARMVTMRDLARQQADLLRQQVDLWDAMIAERRRVTLVQQLAEDHEGMIRDLTRQLAQVHQELAQVQDAVARLQQPAPNQLRLLLPPAEARINPEQKAAIKALVDDVVAAAQASGTRIGQGRNDYPAVWDAFKRRFDLAKYDELPAATFDEAAAWLKVWRDRLAPTAPSGEPPPP